MKKIIALCLLAGCALGVTPLILEDGTEIVVVHPSLATKADVSGGGGGGDYVALTDGVATNLTVPSLNFTSVFNATNYVATMVWDATNKVFVVTEVAE